MVGSASNLQSITHPATDRGALPVRFPVGYEHLSFDRRRFEKVRCRAIYFHAITTVLAYGVVNNSVLAPKHVMARQIRTCARGSRNKAP